MYYCHAIDLKSNTVNHDIALIHAIVVKCFFPKVNVICFMQNCNTGIYIYS